MLGNELALEDERLVLRLDDDVVEALHRLHHERDLRAIVRQRDILLHAGAQVLRLADVDDRTGGILPEVASGIGRNEGDLFRKRW